MTKRVLAIADMCTVGQCSLTVALPILSVCGVEACPVPTTLLSTHTVGFDGYSRESLVKQAEATLDSLAAAGIRFDGLFSMYLGGTAEARLAMRAAELVKDGGCRIVDPAMADGGALYPDLDGSLVEEVASLIAGADVVTPNLTEACLLAREPYPAALDPEFSKKRANVSSFDSFDRSSEQAPAPQSECIYCDRAFLEKLARTLCGELGAKTAVITGVSLAKGQIGAFAYDGREFRYFPHEAQNRTCHGAGDLFSSALAGLLLSGSDFFSAVRRAEAFVHSSILATLPDPSHFYGLHFESSLPTLLA